MRRRYPHEPLASQQLSYLSLPDLLLLRCLLLQTLDPVLLPLIICQTLKILSLLIVLLNFLINIKIIQIRNLWEELVKEEFTESAGVERSPGSVDEGADPESSLVSGHLALIIGVTASCTWDRPESRNRPSLL